MKIENFDLNRMYTFSITVYPQDKSNYVFQPDERSHELSGLMFAYNYRDALEKIYSSIGVEYGQTICYPSIRHFVTEQIPYMHEDKLYCVGFFTR